jgi:DNA-binding transcriptional ArsR family regulator
MSYVTYVIEESSTPLAVKATADLLSALAHPVRLQILSILAGSKEEAAGAVVDRIGLPQPMISRHLAILRDAGVLAATKSGRHRNYRIARPEVVAFAKYLNQALIEERQIA